jgi:hypothetical protein
MIEWATHLIALTNQHKHWRERQAMVKKQRATTRLLLVANKVDVTIGPPPPDHRMVVTCVRIAARPLDPGDNLSSSFKGIRDEVAAYFNVNDRDEDLIRFEYQQLKGPSAARVLFRFEPYKPIFIPRVTTTQLATTPKQWHQRGLLKPNVIRHT